MKPTDSDYTRAILVDGVLTTVGGLLEANEEMPDILGDCKVAVAAVLNGADRYILGGGAAAETVISSAHGVRPCAHCNHPVVHCNRCEGWEHTEKDRSCFLSPAPCEDQQNVPDLDAATLTPEEADGHVRDALVSAVQAIIDGAKTIKYWSENKRSARDLMDTPEVEHWFPFKLCLEDAIFDMKTWRGMVSGEQSCAPCDACAQVICFDVADGSPFKTKDGLMLCEDCYVPRVPAPYAFGDTLTQRLLTASTILLDLHGWEACEEWGDEDKAMLQGCIDVVTDAAERTGGE